MHHLTVNQNTFEVYENFLCTGKVRQRKRKKKSEYLCAFGAYFIIIFFPKIFPLCVFIIRSTLFRSVHIELKAIGKKRYALRSVPSTLTMSWTCCDTIDFSSIFCGYILNSIAQLFHLTHICAGWHFSDVRLFIWGFHRRHCFFFSLSQINGERRSMDLDSLNALKRCSSTPTIYNIIPTSNKPAIVAKVSAPMHSAQGSSNSSTSTSTSRLVFTKSLFEEALIDECWNFYEPFRDGSPTPPLNIFAPRARRYSTGFSPLATNPGPMPRLTPRVSQLRQEECADLNSREVNHEREVHTALQISQSWEDLTLDTENWTFKSDNDLTNPLHVTLPTNIISCSSPSPTRYAYCPFVRRVPIRLH